MITLRDVATFQHPANRDRRLDRLRCPFCESAVSVEFDKVLDRWFCGVCGRQWRETDPRWTRQLRA